MAKKRRRHAVHPLLLEIRHQRLAAGITYPKMAERMGMSVVGVRTIENGIARPSFYTLVAMVEELGFTLALMPKSLEGNP